MDIPGPFKTDNDKTIQDLITVNPFATMISSIDKKIVPVHERVINGLRGLGNLKAADFMERITK